MVDKTYDRGRLDEQVAQRLASHDTHLAAINGSVKKSSDQLEQISLQLQRLADQADARQETVKTTADALEKSDIARRAQGEQTWTPVQRLMAGMGAIGALIATVIGVLTYLSRSHP